MRRAHYRAKTLALWLVAAAPAFGSDALRVELLEAPASAGSMTPLLAPSKDGLYLSWLEKTEAGYALRLARWDGSSFGDAATIRSSDHFFANWADFPSVLPLADGGLAAHWLEKAAEGTYEYDIWMSISKDGGKSWGEPQKPHRDGTLSEHGFVSMVRDGDSGFAAVWLDGRNFEKGASDNEMTLRATTFDGESFGEEVLLDARVCECCQTGMARTKSGLFVAYRDRSPENIRDIGYVRYVDGKWTKPQILNADGWPLAGCPVNGPQAAAEGDRLAVAWFTAAEGTPRVQLLFSEDGGTSFGEPIRVDDGKPVGRVDIEWLGEKAVVSWIERIEGRDGEVRVKRVSPSGDVEPYVTVARTGSGRASGFPRMARFRDEIFLSWTESYTRTGPAQVRIARIATNPELLDEPALDFEAEDVEGNTYRLAELEGRVVLLNFWGIWCTSCRQEIPHLVELDRKWRDAGLVVLGADYGDDPDDLPAFIEELDMTYPILLDDGLADDYEVLVYPTSLVIDRGGRIRYRVEGFREESFRKMSRVIEILLGTPTETAAQPARAERARPEWADGGSSVRARSEHALNTK